jgi:hypothetical protein
LMFLLVISNDFDTMISKIKKKSEKII